MSIEKHKAFLDSLEGEKGLPGSRLINEFEWVETEPLINIAAWQNQSRTAAECYRVIERLLRRLRRAESRQTPDLKERVKEIMRDAMDAENRLHTDKWTDHTEWKQYFDMCSPEVNP